MTLWSSLNNPFPVAGSGFHETMKRNRVNKAVKDEVRNGSVKPTGVPVAPVYDWSQTGQKQGSKVKGRGGTRAGKKALAIARSLEESVQQAEGEKDALIDSLLETKEEVAHLSTINEVLVERQRELNSWIDNPGGETIMPDRYFSRVENSEAKFTIEHFMNMKDKDPAYNRFHTLIMVHFLTKGATPATLRDAQRMVFSWGHEVKGKMLSSDQLLVIKHVYDELCASWWFLLRLWIRWFVPHILFIAGVFVVELCLEHVFFPHTDGRQWQLHTDSITFSVTFVYAASVLFRRWRRKGIQTATVKLIQDFCTNQKWANDSLTGRIQGGVGDVCIAIDEGATVELPDTTKLKCVCKQFHVGFSFGMKYIWIPRNCWHNELNALVTRQLQQRLPFREEGFNHMECALDTLYKHLKPVPAPVGSDELTKTFLDKYPATRRAQIAKELEKVQIMDVRVSGFAKIEVMTGKPVTKRKVRFISGFSDGYLAETGPVYYHWQKEMIRQHWSTNVWGKYTYTGGFTTDRVASWFAHFIERGYTFLLLDFGKFDSRNKSQVLRYLYAYYKQCFPEELYEKLMATFNKHGSTKYGIKFSVEATVASGRIDTSMGNTLLSFMLITAVLHALDPSYVDDAYISALGDDNNTALPDFRHSMEDIQAAGALFGHELDGLIIRPGEYHQIEYCNHRLWNVAPGRWAMAPKIGRLLSKTFVAHRHVPDHLLQKHFNGVMLGFEAVRWLPVFRAVYDTWMDRHGRTGQRYYADTYDGKQVLTIQKDVDDSMIYDQFQLIYGFDPTSLENDLTQLSYSLGSSYQDSRMDLILKADGVSYDFEFDDHVASITSQVVSYASAKIEDFI